MYYVYLLQLKNNTVYTGRTDDLKRRVLEHNQGKVSSTRNKLPMIVLYYEAYCNKQDAINRERYLKTGDGRRTIRKQLQFALEKNNIDV